MNEANKVTQVIGNATLTRYIKSQVESGMDERCAECGHRRGQDVKDLEWRVMKWRAIAWLFILAFFAAVLLRSTK